MAKPVIAIDNLSTYLRMIRSSVGSRMFQRLYAKGPKRDLLKGGRLACAFYVSSLLAARSLADGPHATVAGLVRDLERSGWRKISRPRIGCVLVWEEAEQVRGERHRHIGFYLGRGRAVSNSSRRQVPVRHHWTYGQADGQPKRRVIAKYWHPSLG